MNIIKVLSNDTLYFQDHKYRCAIGKNGIRLDKKEGDEATPSGCFSLRKALYRNDKIENIETSLPTEKIRENYGWCDDVLSEKYNQQIILPSEESHESLWRDDDIYDIVVPIGYNDNPIIKGKGSAIFLHIAREDYSPTLGCIALSKEDLLKILKEIKPEDKICIQD